VALLSTNEDLMQFAKPRDVPPVFDNFALDNQSETLVAEFKVVVVPAVNQGWAVYFGPVGWSATQIASGGNKLPKEAAQRLFPNIVGRYRD
jgi:hypothetical protein